MEVKKQKGRQPLPKTEKRVPITIWVKAKHGVKATKECVKVKEKYDAIQ